MFGQTCNSWVTKDGSGESALSLTFYVPIDGGVDENNVIVNLVALGIDSATFGKELEQILKWEALDQPFKPEMFNPPITFGCPKINSL